MDEKKSTYNMLLETMTSVDVSSSNHSIEIEFEMEYSMLSSIEFL